MSIIQEKMDLHPRFDNIIWKLQSLRLNHDGCRKKPNYPEDYMCLIHKYVNEIRDKNLIEKCRDKTFAKQLCIMNDIPFEYFE